MASSHHQGSSAAKTSRITAPVGHRAFDATPTLALAGIIKTRVLVRTGDHLSAARKQPPSMLIHDRASYSPDRNGGPLAFASSAACASAWSRIEAKSMSVAGVCRPEVLANQGP